MNSSKRYFIMIEMVLGLMVLVLAVMMLGENSRDTLGRVSVIVRDSDDAQWAAFKYGVRMAAADRGVEAVIVGTESVLTVEDEQELIENEIENGADAVIVQPVPGEGAAEMLEKMGKRVPVMLVGPLPLEEGREASLPVTAADDYALGQALAAEILEDYSGSLEGKTMGLLSRTTDSQSTARRTAGFCEPLIAAGAEIRWCVAGNFEGDGGDYLEAQGKVDFVAALDDNSVTAAGEYASAGGMNGAVLYGIGHSTQAAYYLDTGVVECLVVPDEFSVGYRSMDELADRLDRFFYRERGSVVSYTILRRENLFSQKNQELLFTMSQ